MTKNKSCKLLTIVASCSTLLLGSCFYFGGYNVKPQADKRKVTYNTPAYDSTYSVSNLKREYVSYSAMGWHPFPSKGNPKLLVIPIETQDDSFTQSELKMIQTGFFGKSDETGWESVSSYYEKSSHSTLKIDGDITSVVKYPYYSSMMEVKYAQDQNYIATIIEYALDAVSGEVDFSDYDYDNDGFIDGIWFVYSPAFQRSNETLFWAVTSGLNYDGTSQEIANERKKYNGVLPSAFSWASVDFFKEGGYVNQGTKVADSHTFIHETGHLLGQDDFYNYDYDGKSDFDTPLGGVDMMDFNIGDHCAFTKYLMGWEKPIVVDENYFKNNTDTITLKSHSESNQSLLIPTKGYNGTVYDEYLLLEYYTPTGLNKKDIYGYTNNLGTFSKPGLFVSHVDARVGKFLPDERGNPLWDGNKYDKLPPLSDEWNKYFMFAPIYSNTKSSCYETSLQNSNAPFYRGALISLLSASGKKIQGDYTGYASNASLFKKGVSFLSKYPTFIFDDGNTLDYDFEISSLDSDECKIKFTKKGD